MSFAKLLPLEGQEKILGRLKNYFEADSFPSGLLITGPRGSGKKTLVRHMTQALHCEQGNFHQRCTCVSCHKVEEGIHPDVHWIGLDEEVKSVKIEEIHELKRWAGLRAYESRKKVGIVVGAERFTIEAANSLLKI